MDEKPDQIIEHIEARRDELGRNLSELETKVRRTTDWHTYYDKNPMMILGAALGGGLLVGAVIGGRSSRPRTRGIKTSYRSPGGTSGTSRSGVSSVSSSYYTPAESGPSSYSGLGASTGAAGPQTPASSNVSGSGSTSGSSAGTTAGSASAAAVASTVSNLTNKLQTLAGGQMHQVNEAVDHIRGALIAFGITKIKEFLSQSVPGLEQHLSQAGGNSTTGSSSYASSGASDYRSGSQNYGSGPGTYGSGSTGQSGNSGQSAQPGNTGPSATNTGRASEADEYAGAGSRGSNPRP